MDTANPDSAKAKIFRDSTIENIRKICELVPMLNITNDPFIARMAKEVAEGFSQVDPDTLRKDLEVRAKVVSNAKGMLAKLRAGAVSPSMGNAV